MKDRRVIIGTLVLLIILLAANLSAAQIPDIASNPSMSLPRSADQLGVHELGKSFISSAEDGSSVGQSKFSSSAQQSSVLEAEAQLRKAILSLWQIQNELRALSGVPENTDYVWISEIEKHSKDLFVLSNGGIVNKKSYGYVGYIGCHEDCVLYGFEGSWNIIVDCDQYPCEVIQFPKEDPEEVKRDYILSVTANGRVLKMLDGRLLEVDEVDAIHTSMWLGGMNVLLFSDGRLLELKRCEIVRTRPL